MAAPFKNYFVKLQNLRSINPVNVYVPNMIIAAQTVLILTTLNVYVQNSNNKKKYQKVFYQLWVSILWLSAT